MRTSDPIFASIFGQDWAQLPPVMKAHYANRPFCTDMVTVQGVMDVEISPIVRLFSPLIRSSRTLVPTAGQNVPVTVHFRSEPNSEAYCFDRIFDFPGREPVTFFSRMVPAGKNRVIEWMRIGVGWHARYRYHGEKVFLEHVGYKVRLFGIAVSLPISWLIGKGSAEEWPLSDTSFGMSMELRHPLLGKIYGYRGVFDMKDMNIDG